MPSENDNNNMVNKKFNSKNRTLEKGLELK